MNDYKNVKTRLLADFYLRATKFLEENPNDNDYCLIQKDVTDIRLELLVRGYKTKRDIEKIMEADW